MPARSYFRESFGRAGPTREESVDQRLRQASWFPVTRCNAARVPAARSSRPSVQRYRACRWHFLQCRVWAWTPQTIAALSPSWPRRRRLPRRPSRDATNIVNPTVGPLYPLGQGPSAVCIRLCSCNRMDTAASSPANRSCEDADACFCAGCRAVSRAALVPFPASRPASSRRLRLLRFDGLRKQ